MEFHDTDLRMFAVIDSMEHFQGIAHTYRFEAFSTRIFFKVRLIGHHTYIFDHTPVHAHTCKAHALATLCECIEEGISSNITSLSAKSDKRGGGREHNKAIKVLILCEQVKVPCALYFWIQYS